MSSDRTPIRIRGKRTAADGEKWHARKQRKRGADGLGSHTASIQPSKTIAASSQRPKRRKLHLSMLEQLPTEIIQQVFVYSSNPELALASPRLADQLNNKQLQVELTDDVMSHVLSLTEGSAASLDALKEARRLLASRFVTWNFFRKWLLAQTVKYADTTEPAQPSSDGGVQSSEHDRYAALWRKVGAPHGFMLPLKLLHGPWTADRIAFLRVFAQNEQDVASSSDSLNGELLYEGLTSAVAAGSIDAMKLLRNLHARPDQQLLRHAVIDCGCSQETVQHILDWALADIASWQRSAAHDTFSASKPDFDFLDPALWAWADRARDAGNGEGEWLVKTLRRVSSSDTNAPSDISVNGGGH